MKTFILFLRPGIILFGLLLFLAGCTKHINDETIDEKHALALSSTTCKPAVFGVFMEQSAGATEWQTIMQKWYAPNGKLAYLKASLQQEIPGGGPLPILTWGEVTYHNNNQVYVKNVLTNDTVMRITLDAQQRPAASYFLVDRADNSILKDTSYYHFTGNRLDSIISLSVPFYSLTSILFRKYLFSYDVHGNLVQVELHTTFGVHLLQYTYDYSKPIAGMLSSVMIDRPYRLLEFMDLLQFPIHHQLVNVSKDQTGIFFSTPISRNYTNYQLQENGLVHSYVNNDPFLKLTFYTGWDCGSSASMDAINRQKNNITSLEDFQRLYPQHKINR
ncbi:MAG: hypothetical protein WCF67_23905 [Chitinophagaceae bacterium]